MVSVVVEFEFEFELVFVVEEAPELNASLNPRIDSPKPLPSSGSFLGPKTSKAIPRITSRCIG